LNILDDVILFLIGKFGKHGKGEDLAACSFAFGKIALFIAQIAEAGLKVERKGIVNLGANSSLREIRSEGIALPG
jgi:hypothetical protein